MCDSARTFAGRANSILCVAGDGNTRRRQNRRRRQLKGASIVGKYFLGWLLGVPVVVLVIIYFIFN
jgi:hypothetical protein